MKNFVTLTFSIAAFFYASVAHAQESVVIGEMISRPNALLVLNPPGSNQGFLLPQLTTTSRTAMHPSSPAEDGLLVFDITQKEFYYWKSNQWVKGLGNDNQTLSFDPVTRKLTLSDGNTVDLTILKEVPTQTGNTGKFLTTDGTQLSWATQATINEIPTQGGNAGKFLTTNGTTVSWATAETTKEIPSQIGQTGKVLTTNGTTVSWITKTDIPTQTGNAGKFLTTDGTVATWTTVTGTITPTLQSYSIDPSDFVGAGNDKPSKVNSVIFEDNTTFITIGKKDDGSLLLASLHLPDGATIQQVIVYYMDRDAKNLSVVVSRKPFAGTNEDITTSFTSSVNSSSILTQTITPIAGKEVIDNSLYSYRLVIDVNPTGDANNVTEATHRVYGAQVKYIK